MTLLKRINIKTLNMQAQAICAKNLTRQTETK